jgi:hypothetical protein
VHKPTDNNPIIIAFRNTVKTPYHALNTHDNLPTLATNPLEQVMTYKTEFGTFNMNMTMAKEYEEHVEYEVYREFGAKRHITSKFEEDCKLQEVQCPLLRGGCNQDEFQAFTLQWSLYRGHNSGRDEMELRHQLINSIDGPLRNDMYDVLGSNTNTMSETDMLDVVEKLAVKKIIMYVDYPTKVCKDNPVKLPPAPRSQAQEDPALTPKLDQEDPALTQKLDREDPADPNKCWPKKTHFY